MPESVISASIVADSISPTDDRLTTVVLKYPRFIHSEVMTHRLFSRNAASSRAIPIEKMLDALVGSQERIARVMTAILEKNTELLERYVTDVRVAELKAEKWEAEARRLRG